MENRNSKGQFIKGHNIIPIWLHTPEVRAKIPKFLKGHIPWSMGKTKKDYPQMANSGVKKGTQNRLGTKQSPIAKIKQRLAKLGKYGELANNYQGGKKSEHKLTWARDEMKQWRVKNFQRDNYTCQKCKRIGIHLHPHHIKNFSEYPELRAELSNGITLCKDCHFEFHKKYGFRNNNLEQILKFLDKQIS